jgi:hypothetical protein
MGFPIIRIRFVTNTAGSIFDRRDSEKQSVIAILEGALRLEIEPYSQEGPS